MQQPLANILETMSHLSPSEDVMPVKVLWYLEVVFFCTHGTGGQELKTALLPLHKNEFEKSILEIIIQFLLLLCPR